MKLILFFILSLKLVLALSEICFKDLGCFNQSKIIGDSIERLFLPQPNHPNQINTKFYLYNRKSNNSEILKYNSISKNFLDNTPTKFIIHGFLQNSSKQWIINMKNEILKKENSNVIIVDWSKGSIFPYEQAVSNTYLVGAEIARMINILIDQKKLIPSQFHLIGMSLGAHIAGFVGKKVFELGRISGLDPAGPYFQNVESENRLDKSDANFVDVIHSDMPSYLNIGLGISKSIGHADFYVNGGFDQPECAKKSEQLASIFFVLATKNFLKAKNLVTCSHLSVIDYYIDSIKDSCKYTAFQCSSKIEFDNGKCFNCSKKGCNQMGYWASGDKELGNLYLNTKGASEKNHLCKINYLIKLKSINTSDTKIRTKGKFSIVFASSVKNSSKEIFDDSNIVFDSNSIHTRLISISDIGDIKNLYIINEKNSSFFNWIYEDVWEFEYIEIIDIKGFKKKFCPNISEVNSQITLIKYFECQI